MNCAFKSPYENLGMHVKRVSQGRYIHRLKDKDYLLNNNYKGVVNLQYTNYECISVN